MHNFNEMKSKKILFLLGLILLTLLVWGQVIFFDFLTFDDNEFITENPVIVDPNTSFLDCLLYQYKHPNYFPLSNIIFRFERVLFGLSPTVFHGFSLLVHVVNVILVYLFSLKLFGKASFLQNKTEVGAFVIALFFTIRPIHVESVAWVIDSKDLLYSCFYLAGLFFYWKWLESNRLINVLIAMLFATLSLLSKSTGITFVVSLFLIDWFYQRKLERNSLLVKIPFVIIAIWGLYIFGFLTRNVHTLDVSIIETVNYKKQFYSPPFDKMPAIIQRFFVASFRAFFWIKQVLFPTQQNPMYNNFALFTKFSKATLIMPVILVVISVILFVKRRSHSFLLFGFVFFLLTLLPAFAQKEFLFSTFIPDRYLYLPMLGLMFILVSLLMNLKKWMSCTFIVVISILWCYKTLNYLPAWKTSERLYDHVIEIDPYNPVALINRTRIYISRGDLDKALIDLDKLALVKHNPIYTYLNRGKIYMDKGNAEKALNDFNFAIMSDTTNCEGYKYRGALFLSVNKFDEAENDFLFAYSVDSSDYLLTKNLARLYFKLENFQEAIKYCSKAVFKNESDIEVIKIKASSYFNMGEFIACEGVLNEVLTSDFKNPWYWNFRSVARFKAGKIVEAYNDYLKAKELGFNVNSQYETQLIQSYNNSYQ